MVWAGGHFARGSDGDGVSSSARANVAYASIEEVAVVSGAQIQSKTPLGREYGLTAVALRHEHPDTYS